MKKYMGKCRNKSLFFRRHVFDRAKERLVSIVHIKKAIANPQIRYVSHTGSIHCESNYDGKRVVVMIKESNREIVAISCW